VWGGVEIRAGEMISFGPGQRLYTRTDGPCHWGTDPGAGSSACRLWPRLEWSWVHCSARGALATAACCGEAITPFSPGRRAVGRSSLRQQPNSPPLGRSRSCASDCEPSCCAAYPRRADQALSRSSGVPDPGWWTRPGSSLISGGGQRTLRARCVGGSPSNSLSAASARSRSRRNSFMRARIVAKSSAARGRVIGSSRSLDLVLTAARLYAG
jgi:hypothetical protein